MHFSVFITNHYVWQFNVIDAIHHDMSAKIVIVTLPDVYVRLFLWKFSYEYNPTCSIVSL